MVRAYFETDGINQPFDKRMNKQRVSKGLVRDRVMVVGSM